MPTRYALIGSGHRAQMYLDAIAGPHADVAELVALLDVNPARRPESSTATASRPSPRWSSPGPSTSRTSSASRRWTA